MAWRIVDSSSRNAIQLLLVAGHVERASANALQLMYYGVYAPTPHAVVSPNGDGFAEQQRELSYKVVRPSPTVTATLVAPGEVPAFTESLSREPGTYPVAFPPPPADPTAEPVPPAEGRWRLDVTATEALTVAPSEGAVIEPVGLVLSTRTVIAAEVKEFPALSVVTTRTS